MPLGKALCVFGSCVQVGSGWLLALLPGLDGVHAVFMWHT